MYHIIQYGCILESTCECGNMSHDLCVSMCSSRWVKANPVVSVLLCVCPVCKVVDWHKDPAVITILICFCQNHKCYTCGGYIEAASHPYMEISTPFIMTLQLLVMSCQFQELEKSVQLLLMYLGNRTSALPVVQHLLKFVSSLSMHGRLLWKFA